MPLHSWLNFHILSNKGVGSIINVPKSPSTEQIKYKEKNRCKLLLNVEPFTNRISLNL